MFQIEIKCKTSHSKGIKLFLFLEKLLTARKPKYSVNVKKNRKL